MSNGQGGEYKQIRHQEMLRIYSAPLNSVSEVCYVRVNLSSFTSQLLYSIDTFY